MKIRLECPGCDAAYQIERERLSHGAIRFTCRKCSHRCKAEMSGNTLTVTPLTSGETLCPNCGHSFSPEAVHVSFPGTVVLTVFCKTPVRPVAGDATSRSALPCAGRNEVRMRSLDDESALALTRTASGIACNRPYHSPLFTRPFGNVRS